MTAHSFPAVTSQRESLPSKMSGMNAIELTVAECPLNTRIVAPLRNDQILKHFFLYKLKTISEIEQFRKWLDEMRFWVNQF